MIDQDALDEMKLPSTNHNEELESISENALRPLFDISRFHFCTQDRRDKGVDLTYEIKKSDNHTGFRFVIQLKATESIQPNKSDGSFSLQLDTSNINYLLNHNAPAFYIFYSSATNIFYYESVTDILKFLQVKNGDWGKQTSHSYRFSKQLLPTGINEMYDAALNHGILSRNLKEKSVLIASSAHPEDRISLKNGVEMTDDQSIRNLIEVLGFELINDGKWGEVLFMHNKATGHVSTTALYNLVLGICNYYAGLRWDALSFLIRSRGLRAELREEMQNLLDYFESTVKYDIGLLTTEEFDERMKNLEESSLVGLYIKMEKAKENYINSLGEVKGEQYSQFVKNMNEVIFDPKANQNIQLTAKCEMILFEGFKNNMDYIKEVSRLKAFGADWGSDQIRLHAARHFVQVHSTWKQKVIAIRKEATESKNQFAYFTALTNEAKVSYQFDVNTSMITIGLELPAQVNPETPDRTDFYNYLKGILGQSGNYFSEIGHVENTLAAYFTLYELYHYTGEREKADKIMIELENVANKYDLDGHINKLANLKNGGTTHERFKNWISEIFGNVEADKKEHDKMIAEMTAMDEAEKQIIDKAGTDLVIINLFPIGYFMFPLAQKERVFDILQIQNAEAKESFNRLFGIAITIANIYCIPIEREGPLNGHKANRGMESFRNLYRIRKAFFESKYYRNENIL